LTFAAPNGDLPAIEVNILHAQFETFLQAQSGAIQQHPDDPHCPFQVRQNRGHLLATEHDRKTKRLPGSHNVLHHADVGDEHALVQEQQCRKRLVLSRSADVPLRRQPRQERRNRRCA
jgi:hypothetical protein